MPSSSPCPPGRPRRRTRWPSRCGSGQPCRAGQWPRAGPAALAWPRPDRRAGRAAAGPHGRRGHDGRPAAGRDASKWPSPVGSYSDRPGRAGLDRRSPASRGPAARGGVPGRRPGPAAAEHPASAEPEPDHRGGQIGHDEHRHLGCATGPGRDDVHRPERTGGERETNAERDQAAHLVAGGVGAAAMPKVSRRLTAVLATAVSSRLMAFAACAGGTPRRYSRT